MKGAALSHARKGVLAVLAFAALAAAGAGAARGLQFLYAMPSAGEYLAAKGDAVTFVPTGKLSYDGQAFRCGRHPTVLDTKLDDYGGAFFGFVLINPERFATLPLTLKRYAYGHECGHQYVGYDEGEADCYAIRRGKAEGWLDAAALERICDFIGRSKGDALHALGARRCAMMRRCYIRARTGRERL
jgi:hypothetical protein